MTRALAFFAQLVLWAAVALIAATVFARSHNQPRGPAWFPRDGSLDVDTTSPISSRNTDDAKPNFPERSETRC